MPIERVTGPPSMKPSAKTICTTTLCLILIGCSGASSPTSPTAANYAGTWLGGVIPQRCVSGGRELSCGMTGLPVRGAVRVTLTPRRGTPAGFDGDLGISPSLQLTVSGSIGADGFLTLTGEGLSSFGRVLLTDWRTREANGAMTGSLTYDLNNGGIIVTWVLDNVVKQ